ncbi:uncharacterized protein B0H18DRAFT_1126472 [Fomitopsis serialis]|uniref:uncharacterized protein n=1 Tax=Fomitopsis serialis TaxID=139415 RepID=UPI002008BEDC|nr:uncharacterized protein B0H18DRAFT_1126472 [Neoantrodia serialis]KAH9913230.1 hypothetical protein B0H18DRAFT_1126472 [Neoantrodia serialis]
MFSITRILIAASLALAVAAVPGGLGSEPTQTVTVTATPTATSVSSCNTGCGAQRCEQVGDRVSSILGALGVMVQGLDGLVGISCNPVVVAEVCSKTPVCCEENGIGSLISVSCIVV